MMMMRPQAAAHGDAAAADAAPAHVADASRIEVDVWSEGHCSCVLRQRDLHAAERPCTGSIASHRASRPRRAISRRRRAQPGAREALREPADRLRVAPVDAGVRAVEQLEAHADHRRRRALELGAEAPRRRGRDRSRRRARRRSRSRACRAARRRGWRHADRVPRQPALPGLGTSRPVAGSNGRRTVPSGSAE